MIHLFSCDKDLLAALQSEVLPCEEVREQIRALKPSECIDCNGHRLHGNGWRRRVCMYRSGKWKWLWYWRVECQSCGRSYMLIPAIVIPDLHYALDVVSEVLVGRLSGQSAKGFEPDRRTQNRWLDRMQSWWPVAQSAGAIRGLLSQWCRNVSTVMEAILRSASSHVGLFFPSHAERNKSGVSARRKYPAIGAHQSCSSTCVARL